ncbi:PAS domain-containing protein [Flavobacterium frigidarium]|jgi:PAS domain S-box-containing protein|uniref:PAS domain-containing protein n=1 Tax=Flavobacterium frigidarium TaxID=99286 RepID=UPI000408BEAE|nr:PAS domain-containing protein [Flavobacterium frigidarium]
MKSFLEYDRGVAKFNQELRLITSPITSWDFYGDIINDFRMINSDAKKINELGTRSKWLNDNWDLRNILKDEVIVVTDASLKIVFASQNIAKMNGYTPDEVVGYSPRMFQGEKTCAIVSNEIREAILNKVSFEKKVINYKKNGDLYYCLIKGIPIFNKSGDLSHFIAFEQAA